MTIRRYCNMKLYILTITKSYLFRIESCKILCVTNSLENAWKSLEKHYNEHIDNGYFSHHMDIRKIVIDKNTVSIQLEDLFEDLYADIQYTIEEYILHDTYV